MALDPKLQKLLAQARKGNDAAFNPTTYSKVFAAIPGWKWENIGTRALPAFLVTSPAGASFDVVKNPKYPTVSFGELGHWLKSTSFQVDVSAVLGVELWDPEAKYAYAKDTISGCCPICFCNIALGDDQKMVHHGCQRPGDGRIHGDCSAVQRFYPYELSPDGSQWFLVEVAQPQLVRAEAHLAKLVARPEAVSCEVIDYTVPRDPGTRRHPQKIVTLPRPETGDWSQYEGVLKDQIWAAQALVRTAEAAAAFYTRAVAKWELRPLPSPGDRVLDGWTDSLFSTRGM